MGLNDHLKTWRFTLSAPPDACVNAFSSAFSGGGILKRAKWQVNRTSQGATAVYMGRSGVMSVVTAFSETGTAEAESAVGSQVTLEMEPVDGRTQCTMWLGSRSTKMGFTADARFIKPYMRKVEDHLRALDSSILVEKA